MESRAVKYALCLAFSLIVTGCAGFARAAQELAPATATVAAPATTNVATSATATVVASELPIANFERVNSVLLRGAAPTDKGIEALNAAGVKTIINLRLPGDGVSSEERTVKQVGMKYVHIPLGFATPETESVAKVLGVIADKNMQPVYIHCRQGADRTGMIVAIYRMLVDNWEFKDAYSEMREHHFKPFLLGMKETVRTCASRHEFLNAVGSVERANLANDGRAKLASERSKIITADESKAEASGR